MIKRSLLSKIVSVEAGSRRGRPARSRRRCADLPHPSPASDRLASAPGAGACEDDADAGHGWTCEPTPRSRRIDSKTTSVVLVVNTSAAASTPVYFAMTGAAA